MDCHWFVHCTGSKTSNLIAIGSDPLFSELKRKQLNPTGKAPPALHCARWPWRVCVCMCVRVCVRTCVCACVRACGDSAVYGHDNQIMIIMMCRLCVSVLVRVGWKPRLPRRCMVQGQPSSHIHPGTVSDSDSDSNKASSIPSDDSHHCHSTPSPPTDEEGMVNCSVYSS